LTGLAPVGAGAGGSPAEAYPEGRGVERVAEAPAHGSPLPAEEIGPHRVAQIGAPSAHLRQQMPEIARRQQDRHPVGEIGADARRRAVVARSHHASYRQFNPQCGRTFQAIAGAAPYAASWKMIPSV
jgi:hypothetical protein